LNVIYTVIVFFVKHHIGITAKLFSDMKVIDCKFVPFRVCEISILFLCY